MQSLNSCTVVARDLQLSFARQLQWNFKVVVGSGNAVKKKLHDSCKRHAT